jgi:hypothetical protein
LQTLFDGATYDIAEVVATPGFDLIVDFVSVTDFTYVQVIAAYQGTHYASIQLYDWTEATWSSWNTMRDSDDIATNYSFWVPCPSNYIGTGGNDGEVRVRINHTQGGSAAHDAIIDVVCLYDRDKYQQDQISSNDTDIATNVTNIATNVTNITSNDTDIAALDVRVTALESTSSGLESIVNVYNEAGDNYAIDHPKQVIRETEVS